MDSDSARNNYPKDEVDHRAIHIMEMSRWSKLVVIGMTLYKRELDHLVGCKPTDNEWLVVLLSMMGDSFYLLF